MVVMMLSVMMMLMMMMNSQTKLHLGLSDFPDRSLLAFVFCGSKILSEIFRLTWVLIMEEGSKP